ncbi:MAG: hypothetical protein V1729_00355 [Candidatus Woesearchaeota archaeon]
MTLIAVLLTSSVLAAYGSGDYIADDVVVVTTTSSGGSGGGGSTLPSTFEADVSTAGIIMSFNLALNDKFNVKYGDVTHSYKVTSVTGDLVKVQSIETFETYLLFKEVPKRFDYDSNGKDDVELNLESVTGSKALLNARSIVVPDMPALLPPAPRKAPVAEDAPAPAPEPVQLAVAEPEPAPVAQEPAHVPGITGAAVAEEPFMVKFSTGISNFRKTPYFAGLMLLVVVTGMVAWIWKPPKKQK